MDWIDGTVAIGNWHDARNVKRLREENIDLILNAKTLFDDREGRSRRRPDLGRVRRATSMLIDLSSTDIKVLVHCHHGRDRSPFLVMLYLSQKMGVGHHEAYDLVKQKRSITVMHWDWVELFEKAPT